MYHSVTEQIVKILHTSRPHSLEVTTSQREQLVIKGQKAKSWALSLLRTQALRPPQPVSKHQIQSLSDTHPSNPPQLDDLEVDRTVDAA